ncbi:MAG: Na+/H+ antiporter subunit D, partial [Actinomycetota bacterium]|nr:Na+/H+ antiporter subunit D [Actinomycetota bacterium]
LFTLPALSLAGLPPLSGFVAKIALVQAGLSVDRAAIVAVSLAVSLLTLFSMSKVWTNAFWGDPPQTRREDAAFGPAPWPMVVATAVLVALSVGIGFAAGPIYGLALEAAEQLAPDRYIEAVLP